MKIINQQGKMCEVFELEQKDCELYGQPKNIKKPQVLLGKYNTLKRTLDVMAEAYTLNSKDKKLIYTMPNK
jgi:hypothetical protein